MNTEFVTTRALKRYDIDARQVWTLFVIYLKQDLRSGKALMGSSKKEYLSSNRTLIVTFGMYMALSLSICLLVVMDIDVFVFSIFTSSFTFFIVSLGVLAESGNVIFNQAEVDIIGHLPIGARTLFAAKLLNLLSFTLLLTVASNLLPAICGIWATRSNALFFLAHSLSAALLGLFATSLVVTSYGALMRYVSKERFDSIAAYSQALLALFFMLAYQLLPRLMGRIELERIAQFNWYYLLYPPAWFSGITMLVIGEADAGSVALAFLAVLSLIILGLIALRKVASVYSSFLMQLAYGSGKVKPGKMESISTGAQVPRRPGIKQMARKMFLPRPVERGVFDLVSVYLRRNREIKVRLYPSLAYFIIFPLIALLREGLPDPFIEDGPSFYSLMGAAMVCFVALTAIEGLIFSEHYEAAYIFYVAPINRAGEIYSGIRKVILVYVALPGFATLFLLYALLWRTPVHALLVLTPWMMLAPVLLLVPFLFRQVLPLARKYQKGQQSARNFVILFASSSGLFCFGALQTLGLKGFFPYWLYLIFTAIASLLIYFTLGKLTLESSPLVLRQDLRQ